MQRLFASSDPPARKQHIATHQRHPRVALPSRVWRSSCAGSLSRTQQLPAPSLHTPRCPPPIRLCATRSARVICQAAQAAAEPTTRFLVRSWAVPFGEHLRIVGAGPALGDWDPAGGVTLEWSDGNDWRGEAPLPPGTATFKIVRVHEETPTEWEVGGDRIVEVPDAAGPVAVTIDGATTSIAVDDAAVENQEEQVELVADRMEAMRNKHDEEADAPAAAADTGPAELDPASDVLGGDETIDLPPESLPATSGPAPETPELPAIAAAIAETAPLPSSELAPAAAPEIEVEPPSGTSSPADEATPFTGGAANGASSASVPGEKEAAADGSITYNFPAGDKTMQEKAAAFLESIKSKLYGSSS